MKVLTPADHREIARQCHAGFSQSGLARRFGVTQQAVSQIALGRWKNSVDEYPIASLSR